MTLPRTVVLTFRAALAVVVVVVLVMAIEPANRLPVAGINDKLMHGSAFLLLAWMLDFAFPKRGFDFTKIGALLGYGLLIELIQWPIAYRSFSVLDLMADAAGIGLYMLMRPLLRQLPLLRARWTIP